MITIQYKHNGKTYQNFDDMLNAAALSAIQEAVVGKLKAFSHEIQAAEGTLTVEVSKDLSGVKIKMDGLPDDLVKKIEGALYN